MLNPEGVLIEGVVDLAFEEDGRWMVIDFKTDRDLDPGLDMYKRQLTLYASAIAQATGKPVDAALFSL